MSKFFISSICWIITLPILAQYPFKEVPFQSYTTRVVVANGMSYKILFNQGDSVFGNAGKWGQAKGAHDMILAIQNKESQKTVLAISHECNDSSTALGDGGSMSMVPIQLKNGNWFVSDTIKNIDFTAVGGTYDNCSGTCVKEKNTILTAEEGVPSSNRYLYKKGKGYRDTSNINGLARYENTGWIVEADPVAHKALHKLYKMGRFVHESALVLADGKTVFLTDDFAPSVFFKFVAKEKNNFEEGQLYAYKEATQADTAHWITLPMELDSLIDIRNVALRMGATYFLRMEWMTQVHNKIYITATGYDNFKIENLYNGKPSSHLFPYKKDNIIDQPYGSVLEFDLVLNNMSLLMAGGAGKKSPEKHFSNPDAITTLTKNGITYLIIEEDIIYNTRGRVAGEALSKNAFINEIYWLDLSIKHPEVDDLKRFLIAPAGSETTGGTFIEDDARYYFVNIQHPDPNNPPPFNKSCTLVIDLGK